MSSKNVLGSALGQVGDLAKQTGQQMAQTPKDLAKAAAKQVADIEIGGDKSSKGSERKKGANEAITQQQKAAEKKFVEAMYAGSTDAVSPEHADAAAQQKTAEDEQKKMEVLKQLQQQHNVTYYQPLVNPPKQEEEHVADKLEREKKEEIYEQQIKEEEKPPPLAVTQAERKTESPLGSG